MTVDRIISDPSLAAVLQVSDQARDQARDLLQLIGAPATPENSVEVAKQQKRLLTSISHLRGLHRNASFAARDTKAQTAERRHDVDRLHLQLQNLYYEQRHLQDEIVACESYDHKYQQLPLIPVEEFLAQNQDHATDDENELMFARIEHERAEREGLEQRRQELLKRKQKLIAENTRRKEDLANLDQNLEKFIDAAKPILQLFEKAP
ncbi:fms interacting protein, putative [Cordyceps militaris CM01]|uniref:Fms interacting protein, putative n=2 Tax=Cordyceps militaris TaxID=73501 RepID=G3JK25_CORMM|nr:fms interacting protein, putative [Cordyceps militaris CM01]ATY59680.1 fms interacting [Cordyceps militaris]EGX92155.1 fms interacting protein, putative [Cordyceps militaris CM01]